MKPETTLETNKPTNPHGLAADVKLHPPVARDGTKSVPKRESPVASTGRTNQ